MMNPTPITGADRLFNADGTAIAFERGAGPFVFDTDGKRYIDYICGTGPVVLGHAHEEFTKRLAQSLSQGICLPGYGAPHSKLARRFEEHEPGKKVISFFKSSSDAVSAAVRCAAAQTGRAGFLRCGFLGWHDALIAQTPYWHEQLYVARRQEIRYTEGYRGVSGEDAVYNWNDLSIETLDQILSKNGENICLFAFDVFQLAFMDEETLRLAISKCRAYGIPVLFDETKTGGRVGPTGFLSNFDVKPDYIVLGKAIGNGAPIALLLGDERYYDVFSRARIGGTYAKELISVNAASHVMDIMAEIGGYSAIKQGVLTIVDAFNSVINQQGLEDRVRAVSQFNDTVFELIWAPGVADDVTSRQAFARSLRDAGILILDGHCSFVGAIHSTSLDPDKLHETINEGITNWKRQWS
ncbi:aminotransferase class III-fold pyridoxal phosphate-dependent enzyme [Agrobacterium vitis]|uniref:aminotransferase class III-fold pyridoxal phosphate-dependent enzyme n=1 Tax=Agrobacterium vitis TaxID=373 RepID=UPI0012E8FCFF|nr:aminotransferase class III-fold pyridoxal phosphate-dependent enzyme [Agrobacterium vitis]MVA19404.1 aminotransferase class III-fold pyridoxal phosphate-dependent enzyme [Agrobacterium vitis]